MTIVYSQNFSSLSLGALPTRWVNLVGTWGATNINPVGGSQGLAASSDGAVVICSEAAPIADMEVRYDVGVDNYFAGVLLRTDANNQNGYLVIPDTNSLTSWNIYKRISSSYTHLGTISTPITGGPYPSYSVRARIQGSIISLKLWPYGTTEPVSFDGTYSDSSITEPGYFGFYNNTSGSGGSTLNNVTLDNLAALLINPTSVSASSIGNTIILTGTEASWTAGTPGSPTFMVSGGTVTAQHVTSATSANITFNAPSDGPVTIIDPSTFGSALLTITGSTATDFSISPTSQTTTSGVATLAYTVTPNGMPSESTTISLSDQSAGGVFKNSDGSTITSLVFTTSVSQTFTYIPSLSDISETITLALSANGGFTTTHDASCVVTIGSITIPVTNSALFWSPGNWDHLTTGTFGVSTDTMQATATGAYLKFNVTGTVNLLISIDNSTNSNFPSGDMPIVRYSINGATWTDVQLSPSQTSLVLSLGLTVGTAYDVELYFKASSSGLGYADVWGSSNLSPTNVLRINGLKIDSSGYVSAPTLRPKRAFFFGDSISAGEHINADGSGDSTQSYVPIMAHGLNCEYGQIAYGGQGWEVIGGANAPAFKIAYDLYSLGRSRNGFSGLDYLFINHGTNDARTSIDGSSIQSDCEAMLTNLRVLCGSKTAIFIIIPPCTGYATNLATAVSAYKIASSDTKVYCINVAGQFPLNVFTITFGGSTEWTYDGVHPLIFAHARLGAAYSAVTISSTTPTPTPTIQSHQLKRARS